jgi:hypothetical protein
MFRRTGTFRFYHEESQAAFKNREQVSEYQGTGLREPVAGSYI